MSTMIFLWLKWRHIVWILILFKFLYCFCYTIQDYFDCQFFAYKAFIGLFFQIQLYSSYLCYLWSERYFAAVTRKCLLSNPSSVYFSFNHKIRSLSTIVSTSCSIYLSAYINHIYKDYSREVSRFFVSFFISLYSLNTLFTETNLLWLV